MTRRVAGLGRAALVAVTAATAALAAGDARESGPRAADVAFDVLVTEAGGATRRVGRLLGARLSAGRGTGRMYLSASPSGTSGSCGGTGVAVGLAPPAEADGPTWAVEARVHEASLGESTVDIRWGRLGSRRAADPAAAKEPWERMVIEEGQRVLLDFVPAPASESACVRSFALELSVRHPGEPGLEDRTIGYEVWMLHDAEGRPRRSRAFRSWVGQGASAAFQFPAASLGPAPTPASDGQPPVEVTIEGGVRGWVRQDGRLDVVVSARRTLSLADGSSTFVEGGRKTATVSSGEAVRMTLPDVTPRLGADPRLVRSLAGHSFALLLVARATP